MPFSERRLSTADHPKKVPALDDDEQLSVVGIPDRKNRTLNELSRMHHRLKVGACHLFALGRGISLDDEHPEWGTRLILGDIGRTENSIAEKVLGNIRFCVLTFSLQRKERERGGAIASPA